MSRPPRPTSSSRLNCSGGVFDWEPALRKLHELNARVEDPTLWNDAAAAQSISRERSRLAASVEAVQSLERDLGDAIGYAELADEEGDEPSLEEARQQLKGLKDRAARAELEALLSGEADGNDAFVEINSGAGGTESCDWAGMLLRMYTRWAQAHGMTVDFLEETSGDQAGIKSVTLQIKGTNAYGWLKTEAGVHRLVRISPFDAAAKRHTSFASVWVYPVVDDAIVIDINPSDVRTDTYRASGAGGQHINKTDSAVRLTHIPTGVAVACQMGRSQHQNREEAWKMLRARLYELELQKREAAAQALEDQKTDIGWGHQIRSYVLAPYQMVKDLRTEVETSDTDGVLDGDLDRFMGASLAQRVGVTREG
ncbi:MAG: peptide chain release factor 2 [Alphaproteobacteria bacterium PA2]|nr:MAG: peptide chain release factor 2 [Alphaproteobacteria bacterium PA2]